LILPITVIGEHAVLILVCAADIYSIVLSNNANGHSFYLFLNTGGEQTLESAELWYVIFVC
jgi:hypothetical protein